MFIIDDVHLILSRSEANLFGFPNGSDEFNEWMNASITKPVMESCYRPQPATKQYLYSDLNATEEWWTTVTPETRDATDRQYAVSQMQKSTKRTWKLLKIEMRGGGTSVNDGTGLLFEKPADMMLFIVRWMHLLDMPKNE